MPLPQGPHSEVSTDKRPLFRLTGITVEGATVIAADAIAATYQSYIGKTVSKADLTTITEQISNLYRNAGYHLSRAIIPAQDPQRGHIRIKVIEGAISDIVIKGDGAERFGVRPLLAPLTAEQPARLKTLERALLLINDRPGMRIADSVLEEIGTMTGRFRLTVTIETWQVYTAFGLDSWGTPAVGPLETYWASSLNSALRPGDTLGLNLSTSPNRPDELDFTRLAYDAPVGTDGARLGIAGAYGEVWPGDNRQQFGTHTRTTTVDIRGSIEPLLTRNSSLVLSATTGLAEVSERDNFGAIYSDHIRTVRFAGDYQLQDDFGGKNYLTVGIRQGLDVLGASSNQDPFLSRFGGTALATIVDFAYTRYQKLTDAWSLKFATGGQFASATLLQSQEYYLGGPVFGRGYYGGQVSGDNAVAGLAELRFDQPLTENVFKGYQLYAFADRGTVWNFHDLADRLTLTSAGGGMRLHMAGDLESDVGIAIPTDFRAVANQNRAPHVYFSLTKALKLCLDRTRLSCS